MVQKAISIVQQIGKVLLQCDGVKNGYNTTYNYPSAERAYEIVENNAEYIIGCLRKNRIRFKLQCGIEDVVEITP